MEPMPGFKPAKAMVRYLYCHPLLGLRELTRYMLEYIRLTAATSLSLRSRLSGYAWGLLLPDAFSDRHL